MTSNVVQFLTGHPNGIGPNCFDEIEAYWHALCAGRLMPYRHEVDPRGISGALSNTFMVERIAPGIARFRLAGQHLTDLAGMDVRGMPMTTFAMPGARDAICAAVETVFAEPARVDLTLESPRHGLRGRQTGRMLLLPLRGIDGEVTRAIGCLDGGKPSGRKTDRFNIVEQSRRTLVGYGALPKIDAPEPDFEAAELARARLRHRKEIRSKLTLVTSNTRH